MSKRFPYGETNFEAIRNEGSVFIDKTKYVEELERQPKFQFFIRPRRFGKTLWLSVLENYYDIHKAASFEALFGDLYIGQHPTPLKNSYLTLRLSFAGITTDQGKEKLISDFDGSVREGVREFLQRYLSEYAISHETAIEALRLCLNVAREQGVKIYLIIDEYDNFANELIANNDTELYYDLLSGEGYVKAFYKAIKEGTSSSIERLFMTGVSPIMLDDLTSGFNITSNITLKHQLNGMLGLTDSEVKQLIAELDAASLNKQQMNADLREYFNGYLFSAEASERVYNTNMVIYFLEEVRQNGKYPKYILDRNIVTDYRKTEMLARKFDAYECLQRIVSGGTVATKLVDRFDLHTIFDDKENYWSMLFYLGLLTIKGSEISKVELGIPNYAIKSMFWENFATKLTAEAKLLRTSDYYDAMRVMRMQGDAGAFVAQFSVLLSETLSFRDLMQLDEKHIKMVLLTVLYSIGDYLVDSERELGAGYADILLMEHPAYPDTAKYEWVIELKYLKKKTIKEYDRVAADAVAQAERYRAAYVEKYRNGKIVKTLVLIVSGKGKVETIG